ncbi:hypothetical protein L596_010613 [Steinernema carpocapsae]|uniref:Uncharacterized protein n=1 Tax=Steinernema carpocapsae TaxID=34508 RepID=A0A4U5PJG7_STECR|nr:hypothetical protein L596_010613 [Steinernema carpocapsae]
MTSKCTVFVFLLLASTSFGKTSYKKGLQKIILDEIAEEIIPWDPHYRRVKFEAQQMFEVGVNLCPQSVNYGKLSSAQVTEAMIRCRTKGCSLAQIKFMLCD